VESEIKTKSKTKMQKSKLQNKIQNLPKSWRKVKLGDVVKVRRGASPRPIHEFISNSGMPWLKIADITSLVSRFVDSTNEYIKAEGVPKSVIVRSGDLVLSNSATPGIPKFLRIKACIHDGWLLLEPDESKFNKNFLYYRLIFDRKNLVQSVTGSIFNNLKTDVLKNHLVPLPPIDVQNKIAEILSAFDDKIELNNEINQNLEEMAQAIFKEWFVNFKFPGHEKVKFVDSELGKIPKGWEVRKLGEIVKIEYGKGPSTKDLKKNGYPVYGANGIIGYFEKYKFDKSQIIIGCRGVVGSLFKTLPKSSITHNSLIINHADFSEKNYLFMLLKNSDLQSVVGGSAQPQITIKELSQLPVLFAKQDIREKFEKIAENFEQKRLNIIYENQKLASLRDLFLPKLMSGDIKI